MRVVPVDRRRARGDQKCACDAGAESLKHEVLTSSEFVNERAREDQMRSVESAASRCRAVAGGDVSTTSRVRGGAAGTGATATRAGVAKTTLADDIPLA